jgi:hypothetical protein
MQTDEGIRSNFFVPLFTIIIYCLAIIKPHWHYYFLRILTYYFLFAFTAAATKLTKVRWATVLCILGGIARHKKKDDLQFSLN